MNKNKIITLISILVILIIGIVIYFVIQKKDNNSNLDEIIMTNSLEVEVDDYDTTYTSDNSVNLTTMDITGDNIKVDSDVITISASGDYYITGSGSKQIYVNSNDKGTIHLILDNVTLSYDTSSPIYIENANKTIITLTGDNTITGGSNYVIDENSEPDGVIFSRDDLIINGDGNLNITSNYEDAIVSKDGLKILNTNIKVNAKDDAIRGKDYVYIEGSNLDITSSGDGIKSTNDTDDSLGFITIVSGNITINSQSDAIQAQTQLLIEDGEFNIKTTGNANVDSLKGLKAVSLIVIDGGTFNINTTDDGIHSNGNIIIDNGTFTINSNDDAIHADGKIEINEGTLNIDAAEGIEATYVLINGGTININASDDGINAGNKSSAYSVKIEINGGYITIKMASGDTDGIDSNGNIYINGGTIDITANSPFDYDGEAKYTGGTIIVNGTTTNEITNLMMGGMNGGNPNMGGNPQQRR